MRRFCDGRKKYEFELTYSDQVEGAFIAAAPLRRLTYILSVRIKRPENDQPSPINNTDTKNPLLPQLFANFSKASLSSSFVGSSRPNTEARMRARVNLSSFFFAVRSECVCPRIVAAGNIGAVSAGAAASFLSSGQRRRCGKERRGQRRRIPQFYLGGFCKYCGN